MKTAGESAWNAIKNIRAHFAAHLDVAREDGNADQERGARALLEDLDVLRAHVEYEADRIEAAIEADRAQHVKHEPRDWFTQGVYPSCSCGYVPLNNADLIDHWHANGIEWIDEHGHLVSRPYNGGTEA